MSQWVDETYNDGVRFGLKVKQTLFEEQSPFQHIKIVETEAFGRALIIDGVFMTSEYDDFLYHEMLVHPALNTVANPKRVLVIGGGDGGTAREVLRHPEVESCVMIEIDESVVNACKQHLSSIGSAWDDPRLDLRFIDGINYLKKNQDAPYDVILVDSTDPVGPGKALFDQEFFRNAKYSLKQGGIFAIQSASPLVMLDVFKQTHTKLQEVFEEVHPYFGPVPLYATGIWSWTWCAETGSPLTLHATRAAQVAKQCKAYNPELHRAAFALPNYVRELL